MKKNIQSLFFFIATIALGIYLFVEIGSDFSLSTAIIFAFLGMVLEVTSKGEFIFIVILGGLVFWGYFYAKSMDKVVKKFDSENIYLKEKDNE